MTTLTAPVCASMSAGRMCSDEIVLHQSQSVRFISKMPANWAANRFPAKGFLLRLNVITYIIRARVVKHQFEMVEPSSVSSYA